MTPPGRSSLHNWARRLGIAFAVLLVLGIAGELLLRLNPGPDSPQNIVREQTARHPWRYAPDSELGALPAPSRQDTIETLDYTYVLRTDHAGFPNLEPWPNRVDIAVLGDSLLGGPGVGMNGQFTTLLEHSLYGRKVLNLALPGGGTRQQYLTYRLYVAALHPKLVIAVLWVAWDISNSLKFERWRIEKVDPDYTHYRLRYSETHPDGTTAAASTIERAWRFTKRELSRSYLLKAGYGAVKPLLGGRQIREQITFPNGETVFLSVRDQTRLAQGMDRPDTPDLREIFFQPLQQLNAEVEAERGRFLIVLVPSKEELYAADDFPAVLRAIQEVKAGLEARRLPVLDLYPAFRQYGRERPPFYRADTHLNALGNRIVAEALAKWIADEHIFVATPIVNGVAPAK